MGNVKLEINENNYLNTNILIAEKNEIECRKLILEKRKYICQQIFHIEMRYKDATEEEKTLLDRELRRCGNKLLKLVPPRKTIKLLYR